MQKNISIHKVGTNNSPIRKLKLQSSVKKCLLNSTQADKFNPVYQKIFKVTGTNLIDQSDKFEEAKKFQPHLQKVNIQFYESDQTIMPYAYTTNKDKIMNQAIVHQKKHIKPNFILQKKIKSLNQACLAQSVSSDEFSNQNPQIQFLSESQYSRKGHYSPFQINGRPFTISFQPKKQNNCHQINGFNDQKSKFRDIEYHSSQKEDLMRLSLCNNDQKANKTSMVSSLINYSPLSEFKQKNISESLVVFDYNKLLQESQFKVSTLQKIEIKSREAQINKDLINYFKGQKIKNMEMQQNNKIATCKTSQITQPNSTNQKNQNNQFNRNVSQLKTKQVFEKVSATNKQKNYSKIRFQTLQNQTRQNCLYNNSVFRRQYNSADSKYRKLQPKNSLQKKLKNQNNKQKIKKQIKLSLSKNLVFHKNQKPNKLKLKDKTQQNMNKIQYKKHCIQQQVINSAKNTFQLQNQQQITNSFVFQTTNFSQLKNVNELKKIKQKWSHTQYQQH